MVDEKWGDEEKDKGERLQTCSEEERNQNGVSEGMCKLGQTLLRLLLLPPLLLPPPPPLLFLSSLSSSLGGKKVKKKKSRKDAVEMKTFVFRVLLIPPGLQLRPLSLSLSLGVSLPLNLISKAHHVLSPVSKGTWPPSISLYAHGQTLPRHFTDNETSAREQQRRLKLI